MEQPPPSATIRTFRPYYHPQQLSHLVKLQAGQLGAASADKALSDTRVDGFRQLACGFIDKVGGRLGFPRRTIAAAQSLYHRFHLFYPVRNFAYQDVSVSALLVASKLEDTLKKLRDIQIAAWQVTNMLEGGPGTADGDATTQEAQRPKLIGIERLLLETICFNFHLQKSSLGETRDPALGSPPPPTDDASNDVLAATALALQPGTGRDTFSYVIRFARVMALPKSYAFVAHLLAIDVHRTLAPLSFPPSTIAVACIYLASFFFRDHPNSAYAVLPECAMEEEILRSRRNAEAPPPVLPEFQRGWCDGFGATEEQVEDISRSLLNVLSTLTPAAGSSFLSSTSGGSVKQSPSFSPASTSTDSPHEPGLLQPGQSSRLLERDRHLLKTGVPHLLSLVQSGDVPRLSEQSFMGVKVRLREVERLRREATMTLEAEADAEGPKTENGNGHAHEEADEEEGRPAKRPKLDWMPSSVSIGGSGLNGNGGANGMGAVAEELLAQEGRLGDRDQAPVSVLYKF